MSRIGRTLLAGVGLWVLLCTGIGLYLALLSRMNVIGKVLAVWLAGSVCVFTICHLIRLVTSVNQGGAAAQSDERAWPDRVAMIAGIGGATALILYGVLGALGWLG